MRVTSQGAGTSREKAYLKVNSTALNTRAKSSLKEHQRPKGANKGTLKKKEKKNALHFLNQLKEVL